MNFIRKYYDYTKETEPPTNYHVWTMISTLSALLGRKCYIPQGVFTIYPNLYIVLVGSPGMKKSSAMNIGKNLLRTIKEFPLAPASMTREAMLASLQQNCCKFSANNIEMSFHQVSAFVTELQEFIGGKHRNQSMIDILTAIWDEPSYEYHTINRDPIRIDQPYVTLLACCTTDWLNEKLKASIISEGLARRMIFVYEEQRSKYVPFPSLSAEQAMAWTDLEEEAKKLRAITGRFSFTEDAIQYWEQLYIQIQQEAETKDIFLQHYWTTKHVLMIKVAMCLSSVLRTDKMIDAALLKIVHSMFNDFERNLPVLFKAMGRNELKSHEDKIEEFIAKAGSKGRSLSDLANEFARDLTVVEVQALIESLTIRKRIQANITNSSWVSTSVLQKNTASNLFDLLLSYKPSTPELLRNKAQPIELDRLCSKEVQALIKSNSDRAENLKQGKLLVRKNKIKSSLV